MALKGPVELKTQDRDEIILKILRSALRQSAGLANATHLALLTGIAFRKEFPAAKPGNRAANAIARGITARQKLMDAEGGSLSAERAANLLGISKTAILKRYEKGLIMAWREERQGAVRFPLWQFNDGKVLHGLEQALKTLNDAIRLDDFGRLLFFLSSFGFLKGKRPLDCLRRGDIDRVLKAAQGYGC